MTDDDDTIVQKIRKAKTDAEPLPDNLNALEGRPEARNLINIYAATSDVMPQAVLDQYVGQGFGAFKPALTDLLVETLHPIRDRFVALKSDSSAIDLLLAKGAARAGELSRPTVEAAYSALGLLR